MSIADNLKQVLAELPQGVRLVAVSKFHPNEAIEEAYQAGQRIFGESKVQEMLSFVKKHEELYIYGAGNYGMRCLAMLRNGRTSPTAFLVSDSSNNPKDIQGIPVYSIKEVELNPRCGIVVGEAEAYREDVIQAIRNKSPEFPNIYLWK